ncbi:RecT-like ssDNA binding protein [Mycobacterium phage Lemuria]|uniref:RecT-like ssDNA binding protein n=1 Tax=Mycobacterium phage Lemuria TaxID=2599868 RepID=A0A5J6THG0_9CAUD|nr:RecT-like ssDNA annealing protein [Mycobacterium phage Lemuria]QFG10125.1 RecT-like ssDNA binding protein [Mycobacterium phage Lemuria]
MTSNELAEAVADPRDAGTLEVFPPANAAPSTMAVAMLHEHARLYNTAWKLAGQLVQTTMVPKRFFRKQGDATAAILYGAELGLNPIQSLQRVVPIHGMPSLEARTMVGLLKARRYKVRTTAQSDESVTVEGEAPDGEKYASTWTIGRAKLAGYVPTPVVENPSPDVKEHWVTTSKTWDGKTTVSIVGNMKYITDPQTMLKAKAQAEVCRELAPDVLMGISYTSEELESEDQRQFDERDDNRGESAGATRPVSEDEILAEEVSLDDGPIPTPDEPTSAEDPENTTGNPRPAADQPAPETPAGDVSEDQGDGAPEPEPSPAEQTEPEPVDLAAEGKAAAERAAAAIAEEAAVKQAATDREAKATSAKVSKARSTAPAADPERPKSRMRKALEKRLFPLLGEAGLADEKNRDGRIALYRAVLDDDSIESTDDLDDPAIGKVADVLYAWSQQNVLDEEVAAILTDAARAESDADAPAPAPTSEGTE